MDELQKTIDFTNTPIILTLIFAFYLFFFIFNYFVNYHNNISRENVYEYIRNHVDDCNFQKQIIKLLDPNVGNQVVMKNGKWQNLIGKITHINDDNTFNIKITKNLNGNVAVPNKVIIRPRNEFNIL